MKYGVSKMILTGIAIAAVILGLSCSFGNVQTRRYYTINYTPASNVPAFSRRPYANTLQVGRFEVRRVYNRQNIIYRYSPHQIQYYELELWAVRPEDMVRDLVFQHFEESRLFNRISLDFLDAQPDFRLDGTVETIEKLDAGDLFFAHLAMTFRLVEARTGSQIWSYSFDQRRQVYSSEMLQTVRSLSGIFQSEMEVAITKIDSLMYTRQTGRTLDSIITNAPVEQQETPQEAQPRQDEENGDLDETDFEIIPERQ